MRIAYLNGERVYVVGDHEKGDYVQNQCRLGPLPEDKIQYCRHADIVKTLNNELANTEPILELELALIIQFITDFFCCPRGSLWSEVEKETMAFDDPKKLKLAKSQMLRKSKKIKNTGRPQLIYGALYEPPAKVINDDNLSDEFKSWLSKHRLGESVHVLPKTSHNKLTKPPKS